MNGSLFCHTGLFADASHQGSITHYTFQLWALMPLLALLPRGTKVWNRAQIIFRKHTASVRWEHDSQTTLRGSVPDFAPAALHSCQTHVDERASDVSSRRRRLRPREQVDELGHLLVALSIAVLVPPGQEQKRGAVRIQVAQTCPPRGFENGGEREGGCAHGQVH